MTFLELRQATGVYSRVTAGMTIWNSGLFTKSGLLSSYDGQVGKLNYVWKENTDASGGEP